MSTTSTDSIVRNCRQLQKKGKLIPFIGAGLSKRFNLPSSDQLVDIIAKDLDWDSRVFKLSGNFFQLAEYHAVLKNGIGPLRSLLDREFNPPNKLIALSKAHTILTKLDFPIIYTTNFDTILERAFKLQNKPFHVVKNISDIASARRETVQIVKFHGTFEDDQNLVLTESSYFSRFEFESPLDIKLRADILGKCLLFIGHSVNDINIRYMIYKLHKLRQGNPMPEEVPVAIMITFSRDDVQRRLLKRWGVTSLELDPINKDKSTDEFLEQLL